MVDLPFSCRCGQVKGTLALPAPDSGNHVRCYCRSCRAAALYTGDDDPGVSGVTLFQTTPDRIKITQGKQHLGVFSFGPRNILRWQANCCGAALFTTLRTPKFPMAALICARLATPDAIGPVRSEAFVPQPGGKTKHRNKRVLIGGTLRRALAARLSGRWKQTPFFDAKTWQPIAEVVQVSDEDRRAALAAQG